MSKRKSRPTNYRVGSDPYQLVVSKLNIASALVEAAKSNDMVPPRPEDRIAGGLGKRFTEELGRRLAEETYAPTPAYIASVQKPNLTTRQAALLTFEDRVIFTALVDAIRADIDHLLVGSDTVLWPRGLPSNKRWDDFKSSIVDSNTSFVATSDITEFYASVEHRRLGSSIVRATGSRELADALVHFLSKVLDSDRGLPQGLPASDALATLYLAGLDDALIQSGLRHMRHGDDIRVAAKDRVGARRAVLRLEGELRALGLYMNGEKTRIYSREEYLDWINMHDRQVDAARERRVQTELDAIAENEDLLESALGPERTRELMLDAMYGDGELLQEAIEELRGTIEPEKREVLEQLFLDIFEKRPGQSEALGRVAFDRCLRASMIVLTASKSEFALKYMGQLLTEVPHQTRLFCSYLTSLRAKGKEVAEAVTRAIDACTTEAELGWLVRVLNIVYSHVPGGVVETLRETMRNPHGRWLAAVEIAKLLARRGELKRDELVSLWRACPAMFKPDLVVAAVWMEEHERWAKEWVVGTKSDAIFSEIAKAVRASRQR